MVQMPLAGSGVLLRTSGTGRYKPAAPGLEQRRRGVMTKSASAPVWPGHSPGRGSRSGYRYGARQDAACNHFAGAAGRVVLSAMARLPVSPVRSPGHRVPCGR